MSLRNSLVAVAACCLAGSAWCAARPPVDQDGSRISIQREPDLSLTSITIQAQEGRVAWSDVLRGLARAKGFDDDALDGLLPRSSVKLLSFSTAITLAVLDQVLGRGVRLSILPAPQPKAEPHIVITLDRDALLASRRRFKALLRRAFRRALNPFDLRADVPAGLELEDGWDRAPAGKALVIIVHGYQSTPERLDSFLEDVRGLGLPAGVLRYPNDQPVEQTAAMLARELADVSKRQPERAVALVATSMGGLVARAVVEDPKRDPGNVRQLILVGTPNHGSQLAHFGFALELWEHLSVKEKREPVERFYRAVEDGLGEARADLRPGSAFLRALNDRPRNPRVRYSLLLGSGALLPESALELARVSIRRAGERNRFVRFFGAKVDTYLADLDEVVAGKGDGAVAIKRGRLAGVADTVILPFDHLSMLSRLPSAGNRAVKAAVLARLREGPPKH